MRYTLQGSVSLAFWTAQNVSSDSAHERRPELGFKAVESSLLIAAGAVSSTVPVMRLSFARDWVPTRA